MRTRSTLLLLVGAIAVAALVLGPAATAGSEGASAGTVVFIHDQEPPNLNQGFVGNGLYATSLVMNNIFLGGQIRDNKSAWVLRNFKSAPKLLKKSPLTISVEYKPEARWSDGKPVTGADLWATWKIYVDPRNNVISRTGWEDIRSVKYKGKKATVVFKRPFAAWEYPSWRQVLHAGQWDESRVSLPAGQSGHPLSPHYFDQNEIWRDGGYRLQPFSRAAVQSASRHRLLLIPGA